MLIYDIKPIKCRYKILPDGTVKENHYPKVQKVVDLRDKDKIFLSSEYGRPIKINKK